VMRQDESFYPSLVVGDSPLCRRSSLRVCGAQDRTRLLPSHSARVSPSNYQIPFTSVCPRHREYEYGLAGIEGRVRDQFVVQLEEEEEGVQYLVSSDNTTRQIYLDWPPAQTTRTIKLNFICSNRCCE